MMIWNYVCAHFCSLLSLTPDLYAKLIVKVRERKHENVEKFIGNFIFCSNNNVFALVAAFVENVQANKCIKKTVWKKMPTFYSK